MLAGGLMVQAGIGGDVANIPKTTIRAVTTGNLNQHERLRWHQAAIPER